MHVIMLIMENMIKKIFSWSHKDKAKSVDESVQNIQTKKKKEEVILRVGECYGRAITRLSDT